MTHRGLFVKSSQMSALAVRTKLADPSIGGKVAIGFWPSRYDPVTS
jgi:hypothetical protein